MSVTEGRTSDAEPERSAAADPEPAPVRGLWSRLGECFSMEAMRPRLAADVLVMRRDEQVEAACPSTGGSLLLEEGEERLLRQFDGRRSVSELIVADLEATGRLEITPVVDLVDRAARARLLEDPQLFSRLERHVVELAAGAAADLSASRAGSLRTRTGGLGEETAAEHVPWRPRTPLLADRAAFLRQVPVLRPLDLAAIGTLAEAAREETHPAASSVIREGQQARRFYVVRSGELNVTRTDAGGVPRRIAKLGRGDYFGEAGLLEDELRSATVRASPARPVQLLSFESDVFERVISPHVAAFRGRQEVARRRSQLERIELFSQLDREELEQLAESARELRAPAGVTVCEQGTPADRFYIVAEGALVVVRDGDPVATLGAGEFFGETALLFTSRRTASVVATQDTLLWSIDKASFDQVVRERLLNRRETMSTVLNRLQGQD